MKILTLDIESAPNLAHVWQLWGQQHVGLNQLMEASHLLCVAWKWHSEDEVRFTLGQSYYRFANLLEPSKQSYYMDPLFNAVNEADAIITYNGKKYDMPKLNSAFIEHEYNPPAPYAQIDLYQVVRKVFGWPSNKLDFVAQRLLGEGKKEHEGHDLWVKCMAGDPEAWATMRAYNEQDVRITERLYDKLKPWIPGHPNVLLYEELPGQIACPTCGSDHFQRRGTRQLATGVYQQYQCRDCWTWFREVKRQSGSTVR